MVNKMVNITQENLDNLCRRDRLLNALERKGVDNWDFYEDALDDHNNENRLIKEENIVLEKIEMVILDGAYEPSERGAGYATTDEARFEIRLILNDYINSLEVSNR